MYAMTQALAPGFVRLGYGARPELVFGPDPPSDLGIAFM